MFHWTRNAASRDAPAMPARALAVIGLGLVLACDRVGPLEPSAEVGPALATAPPVLGNYTATGVVKGRTSSGLSSTYNCAGTISIPTQFDSDFTGTFAVQASGDCSQESGTLAGTIAADGAVSLMADLQGGGANVWEDGAARSGCRLVSGTPFTGTLSGNTLSVTANGVYDCPSWFGTFRVYVDAQVSATRA